MSPTQPPSPPSEQQQAEVEQLVGQIIDVLTAAAPEDWRTADVLVRMTGEAEEISLTAFVGDGDTPPWEPPAELLPLLRELREKKYVEGRGTWLSMRMVLEPSGNYVNNYNFDLDPLWEPPIEADQYRRELELFPRGDDWIPDWLRGKLGDAPAGPAGPSDFGKLNDLLFEVVNYLKFALPAGWDYVQVQVRAVGDYEEAAALVTSMTGAMFPWTPPEPVLELFRRHRVGYVSAEHGTWVSTKFELRFPESMKADLNVTEDPGFRQAPPAREYAEELRRYPRSEEFVPGWLRDGAAGADG